MSVLRVLLADAPSPDRAESWALFDAGDKLQDAGCARPDAWPRADRCEAVISATRARITVVALPPLSAARLQTAAAFALEEQLAGPIEAQHLVAMRPNADGRVRVIVVDKALLRAIAAAPAPVGGGPRFSRVIAEVGLVPPSDRWQWCIDAIQPERAFVSAPDGSAFLTTGMSDDAAMPPELVLLVGRPTATGAGVSVHGAVTAAQAERWSASTGASFSIAPPWCWHDAPAAAFAAAADLLPQETSHQEGQAMPSRWRAFRPAAMVATAALALHVVATAAEWTWLRVDAMRNDQAWRSLAVAAGIPAADTPDAATARAAVVRRFGALRHANGAAAPGDPLPMLARAAPLLARLPAGALKAATYAGGTWTIELGPVDAATLHRFDANMKAVDLPVLLATTSAGTRARFGSP